MKPTDGCEGPEEVEGESRFHDRPRNAHATVQKHDEHDQGKEEDIAGGGTVRGKPDKGRDCGVRVGGPQNRDERDSEDHGPRKNAKRFDNERAGHCEEDRGCNCVARAGGERHAFHVRANVGVHLLAEAGEARCSQSGAPTG